MSNAPSLLALAVLLSSCASRWEMRVDAAEDTETFGAVDEIPVAVSVQPADRIASSPWSGDLTLDFAQSLVKRRVFDSVRFHEASEPEADTVLRFELSFGWWEHSGQALGKVLTLGIANFLFESDAEVHALGEVTLRRSGQDLHTWRAKSLVRVTYLSNGKSEAHEAEASWAAIEAVHADLIGQMRRDRAVFTAEADRQATSAGARPPPDPRP